MDEPAGTCSGCGRPLRADAEFCGYCGTKAPERRLAAVAPPEPEPVAPEPEPEPVPEPEPQPEPLPIEPEPAPPEPELGFIHTVDLPEVEEPGPGFDPDVEPADDDEPSEGISYTELYAAAAAPETRGPSEGTGRFRLSLTFALLGLLLICIAAYLVYR